MNLVFIPQATEVPEWKQCYFDHSLLKHLLAELSKSLHLLSHLKKNHQLQLKSPKQSQHLTRLQKLEILINVQLEDFYLCCHEQSRVFSLFAQYKIYEIQNKFIQYVQLIDILKMTSNQILILLQNLYIQSYYLHHSIKYNILKKTKTIHKLHQIQTTHQLPQPQKSTSNQFSITHLNRINLHSKTLKQHLQQTYTSYCIFNNKQWSHITDLSSQQYQQKQSRKFRQSLYIGIIMGGFVSFIAILIMLDAVNQVGIGTNSVFTDHFPVWRGGSQVVFYVWVLGLNIWFYEKTQINYKLIFFTDEMYNLPSSKFYFEMASIFSFVYLVLFMVFMLEIIGTIQSHFIYYGQIFWLILLIYLIQPLPILHHKGRFYLLKMFSKIILSFCFPMNPMIIWLSQQIISLTQPITDLFYTIFFFITKNITLTKLVVANFNSGLVIIVFFYRMVQNLKFWYQLTQAKVDKKYDFKAPPFLGFFRAFFGCLTAICGMVYRLKLFPNAFILWLVFIIISTLVAWYVDVRGDWGLLVHENKTFLRPKLLFPKYKSIYIFILVLNLGLRAAWALTISPFFVNSTGVWGVLWVMFISFIEIIRRGIWNILRIQNQHVRNCQRFQATVGDQHILKKAKDKAVKISQKRRKSEIKAAAGSTMRIISDYHLSLQNQNEKNSQGNNLRKQRIQKQLEIFKEGLIKRDQLRKKVSQDIKKSKQLLNKLKNKLFMTDICGKVKIR